MKYELADGTKFDLENIEEVSEIKDHGLDQKTIDECTLSFTLRFKVGKSIKVSHNYHYNDWFVVMKELKNIRNDILEHWKKVKHTKK